VTLISSHQYTKLMMYCHSQINLLQYRREKVEVRRRGNLSENVLLLTKTYLRQVAFTHAIITDS